MLKSTNMVRNRSTMITIRKVEHLQLVYVHLPSGLADDNSFNC